jgi:hypothetical protein
MWHLIVPSTNEIMNTPQLKLYTNYILRTFKCSGGRRGRDRMVVGFITTYANNDYHQ